MLGYMLRSPPLLVLSPTKKIKAKDGQFYQ